MIQSEICKTTVIIFILSIGFACTSSRKDEYRYTQIKDIEICDDSESSVSDCNKPFASPLRRPSRFDIKVTYDGFDPEENLQVSLLKNNAPFAAGRLLKDRASQGTSYSRFDFDAPLIPGSYFITLRLTGEDLKLVGQTGISMDIAPWSQPKRVALCTKSKMAHSCEVDLASVPEDSALFASVYHKITGENEFIRMIITEYLNPFESNKESLKTLATTDWEPVQKINHQAFIIPSPIKKGSYSIRLQYKESDTFDIEYSSKKAFKVYSDD